ncbi:hypothetical protein KSP39_PZI023603 [Platanthera zijinensis]|uniref:Uncharacterized protein n=1 Tax=Platanthera zijinensis TaxID=2320716 RepID=A0AAP0FTZ5_9ASPA
MDELKGNSGEAAELSKKAPAEIVIEENDDFEFTFSIESESGLFLDVTADEIFNNGRLLPVYPLFQRDLMDNNGTLGEDEEEKLAEGVSRLALKYETRDERSRSEASALSVSPREEDPERHRRLASENLVWESKSAPQSPNRWRKSSSTGSEGARKWKLRDLVVGRSRSDGKERFVVIPPSEKEKKSLRNLNCLAKSAPTGAEKKNKSGKTKGDGLKEMDIVTAHRIYYGRVGSGVGPTATSGTSRRSFLPYRQELLGGIFGSTKHNLF